MVRPYYINSNEIRIKSLQKAQFIKVSIAASSGDLFTCEENLLFSRVKISCFRTKAHLVFHWCLYNKCAYRVFSHDVTAAMLWPKIKKWRRVGVPN